MTTISSCFIDNLNSKLPGSNFSFKLDEEKLITYIESLSLKFEDDEDAKAKERRLSAIQRFKAGADTMEYFDEHTKNAITNVVEEHKHEVEDQKLLGGNRKRSLLSRPSAESTRICFVNLISKKI